MLTSTRDTAPVELSLPPLSFSPVHTSFDHISRSWRRGQGQMKSCVYSRPVLIRLWRAQTRALDGILFVWPWRAWKWKTIIMCCWCSDSCRRILFLGTGEDGNVNYCMIFDRLRYALLFDISLDDFAILLMLWGNGLKLNLSPPQCRLKTTNHCSRLCPFRISMWKDFHQYAQHRK